MNKPVILPIVNHAKLQDAIREYLDALASDDIIEDELDDYEHDIFEAAISDFCGAEAEDWISERMKRL